MKENKKAKSRHISEKTQNELWAKSAGRCQFDGCNVILYESPVTLEPVNRAQKAHIQAFSELGPRGKSETYDDNPHHIENLMLLCAGCHKLIDEDKNGDKYSVPLLQQWKKDHEARVRLVTGIADDKKSHVVLYGSNIGHERSPLLKELAVAAMFPDRYPTQTEPIILSMVWQGQDKEANFWDVEEKNLKTLYERMIVPVIENNITKNFSLFALAPMPLLIKLGTLFTDKINVYTYQLLREPKGWNWQTFPEGFEFLVNKPKKNCSQVVLVISISDVISHDRITAVLGEDVSIWELTVPQEFLHNDSIRHPTQLSLFRSAIRKLMVEIKQKHSKEAPLSIFPAMSVSCSVEMGRARMPKADMPWVIYDQNNAVGGFIKTLTIGD